MMNIYLLTILVVATVSNAQTLERQTCITTRSSVDVDMTGANAVIGGLFEMRRSILGGYACGEPHKELMQVYEAARWALQKVNSNNMVPGIKIGMKAYDTCSSEVLAVKYAQDFYTRLTSGQYSCTTQQSVLSLGFLGPLSSWTTSAVAEMTGKLPASVLSPRAMSTSLSDTTTYPYFLRTSPSSRAQAKAILAVLNELNWKRVVAVYTDSVYGNSGYEAMVKQSMNSGICITKAVAVPNGGSMSEYATKLGELPKYDADVAVFFGSYLEGTTLFGALQSIGGTAGIRDIQWIVTDVNLMQEGYTNLARGILAVVPRSTLVTEFRDYFVSLNEASAPTENPWLANWYMTQYRCKLPGVTYTPYVNYGDCVTQTTDQKRNDFRQNSFVDRTIMAVFAYAKALRNAQMGQCGSTPGMCASLQILTTSEFHEYLKDVDFQFATSDNVPSLNGKRVAFDENGDFITEDFTIWNYNDNSTTFDFHEVGSYENGVLTLNKSDIRMYDNNRNVILSNLPTSPCPTSGCGHCVIPRDMVEFVHIPGDLLIGGVVDAHYSGSEPLSCGDDKPEGMMAVVAFYYAIQTAKSKMPGILNGVNLGGIIADLCESAHAGNLLFSNILAELHVVRDKKGRIVNPKAINIMTEIISSPETLAFTSGMKAFDIQELGVKATSSSLSDKMKYPNYARVIPSDDKQAVAMTQFFARNGWKFIQTINSPNDYGRTGIKDLRRIAAEGEVCLAASYEIDTDGTMDEILTKIREQPQARVVVLFVSSGQRGDVLKSMKALSWQKDYVFVGTDAWIAQMFAGYEEYAPGFISFQPQNFGISSFETWANSINPRQADAIPGFSEWYESVNRCYIVAENRGKYTTACGSTGITSSPGYFHSRFIAYEINAVYMAALALDSALKVVCGRTYNGVCSKFRANTDVADTLKTVFNNISFVTEYGSQFKVEAMESLQGYDILNYQTGTGFVQIGQFNTEQGRLSNQINQQPQLPPGLNSATFKSTCTGRCAQCTYVYNPGTYMHIPGDVEIGGIFGIHDVSTVDPYICGALRTVNGFQFSAAIMYAINQINSKSAPINLRDVKLGGLILDHCNVESRRFDVLSSLYSGLLPVNEDDNVDVAKVRAWMTDNTRSVIEVNEVVKPLDIPLISPLATSSDLVDKDMYPTFFRTIQGDVTLSVAMAKLAKALKFRYVTVLYTDDEYGHGGFETFTSVSTHENVCIVSSYKIDPSSNMTHIVNLIASSDVNVVILWTTGPHTAKFFQERAKTYASSNIVVIAPIPFMGIAQSVGANGGKSFFLNIKTTVIDSYMNFVRNLPNTDSIKSDPFLMEYYMKILSCDLPNYYNYGVECNKIQTFATWSAAIVQDNYVIPTINAVYSFAAALDVTLREKCGSDYKELCSNFLNTDNINNVVMEKMETLTFKDPSDFNFRYIDREGNTGMDLIYYDGTVLRTVGEFAGASLQISDSGLSALFPGTKSSCVSPCTVCINNQMDFSYIPGDILIGGVFDVHEKDVSAFSCASIKKLHGFQLLEAFHYAITTVNDKSGQFANILKNIKLGGVGLDACESAIKTGYTVSDVHNGLISLTKNGVKIDPDDISAYIAGYSSDSSLYLARILKSLKIPQISYASTSIALSDQDRYPYFMRSVPADDNLAEALVKYLDHFDIRYVQVIYSPNNYGRLGSMAFQNLAKDKKICIGQMIQFPDNGTATAESSNEVVSHMLKKPTANTIIMFANTQYINTLFQAIRRNPSAIGKYHFLGTETWGNNLNVISGVEDLAKDTVTWSLESTDIGPFDTYLSTKSPANYPQNPWFPEFYEDMVNCYLTVPDGIHPVQCASLSEKVISQRNYIQDPGILHVINSVYAAAIGIDSALKSVCGQNYSTVCEKFRNDANRRDILMDNILKAKFNDPTGSEFEFTDKRDGNKGYQMFSISTRMEGAKLAYYYKKIGTFSNDQQLSLEMYSPSWNGSCSRPESCTECPAFITTKSRYMLQATSQTDPATLIAFLPIHLQGDDQYKCGKLYLGSLYRALAITYTLQNLAPTPFNLRAMILDTCSNSLRIDQDLYNILASGKLCNTKTNFDGVINNSTVGGVVTESSEDVMAANRILAPLKIPLVGSFSTSSVFNNKFAYPYLARTISPDTEETQAIADILKHQNWTYVSVVYSKEVYGLNGYKNFKKQAGAAGICIATSISIQNQGSLDEIKNALSQLTLQDGAHIVVVIALNPRPILDAANELGILKQFLWIGTETWGRWTSILNGLENDLKGSISIAMRNTMVTRFNNFIKSLTYVNRKGVPDDWFEEFYQQIHKCKLSNAVTVYTEYLPCSLSEKVTDEKLEMDKYIIYTTIAAAYSVASGINRAKNSKCPTKTRFEDCFNNNDNREYLFQMLLDTKWSGWTDDSGYDLTFNNDRYWDVGYDIFNFVEINGTYIYKKLGSTIGDDSRVLSSFTTYKPDTFKSQCPSGKTCSCDGVVSPQQSSPQTQTSTKKEATEPRNYFYYQTEQLANGDIVYKQHYIWPIWAIAVSVPTCVGLLIGICIFCFFLFSYPVRGGTTVLGFMMIIGIVCIYALNFAFFVRATNLTCGLRRFLMGVVYAIVFAALLVKSIDNWRFNDIEYSVRKYSGLTSACSLFTIAVGIVCVQIIIPVEWLIVVHPTASKVSTNVLHDWSWCDPVDNHDYSLVLSMFFVMFLVLLTAIFSGMAWDSHSNYYESRWICVSCISTAGCFLVWMVVSTNAGPPYRDAAVSSGNFFNATALLIFLPVRKLILLFHFKNQEDKEEIVEDPYAQMDQGTEFYTEVYSNEVFEDVFQPLEVKPDAENGF